MAQVAHGCLLWLHAASLPVALPGQQVGEGFRQYLIQSLLGFRVAAFENLNQAKKYPRSLHVLDPQKP